MFEKASRLKLRFESPKGFLTVEDLWDLPLSGKGANLDEIAISLSQQVSQQSTVSFVNKPPKADDTVQLKFEIVKHIIEVRLAERDAAKAKAEAKEKKDKILAIIARKQDAQLEGASLDELQKMVETM